MRPALLEMNLGDEEAWEIGLTCGGTIEVFVEPLALDRSDDVAAPFLRSRAHSRRAGGRGAIVTRLDGEAASCSCSTTAPSRGRSATPSWTSASSPRRAPAIDAGASRTLFLEGVRAFVEVVRRPRCCW